MSAQPRQEAPLLRPLRLTDLTRVMEIEQRAYPFPWSESTMRDCFKSGYQSTGVELEARLIGYGWISCAVGEAHILNIATDAAFQAQGHGRRVLKRLIDIARWYRAETVFLEVRASNEIAIGLYQNYGFNEIGLRKGYYPAQRGREDALVFAMTLLPPEAL